MRPQTSNQRIIACILVVLAGLAPVGFDLAYRAIVNPLPFWIRHYDPELIYFFDGMRLLEHRLPANVDNPGTPVQLLSAATLLVTGENPLAIERFRRVVYAVGFALTILAAFILACVVFRESGALIAILGIWTFYLAPAALEYSLIWSPEILYFLDGALMLAALRTRKPLLAGLALGFAIATKFTFLAWVPAMLIAVAIGERAWFKRATIAAAGTVCGFVAATSVAAARYGDMFRWLIKLATRSGHYGAGGVEAPRLASSLAEYANLAIHAKGWILWLVVIAVVVALSRNRTSPELSFAIAGALGTVALAIRNPMARYLIPLAIAAMAALASVRELRRGVAVVLIALALVLSVKSARDDIRNHDRILADDSATRDVLDAQIREHLPRGGVVIYGWRSPEPSFAMRIMSPDAKHLELFERVWPNEGHVDWQGRIVLPRGAQKWDLLIYDSVYGPVVRDPIGPVVGRVHTFLIAKPPTAGR